MYIVYGVLMVIQISILVYVLKSMLDIENEKEET